ncbi:MAG: efflux RND transporter periplasmic adaptor subunit [Spirochaetaceae bacterium]|jgi:multidrug efflux pump subunit AcrA (membrane-fusion protein)|nr:efflux RND transporter periplasmic adaptor subunit [Spirochaetaceae bacterium]
MKKLNPSKVVTVIIVMLIAAFAFLIARSFLAPKTNAAPASAAIPPAGGSQNSNAVQRAGQAASGAPSPGGTGAGRPAGGNSGAGGTARNATVVRATAVKPGIIETGVVINGDVLAGTQVSIYPQAAGKLTETRLEVGDTVSRGQVVAMVDPSRPGEVYSLSPVVSTISGTVLQKPLSTGDTVSAQSAVYVIGDLSSLVLETFVPERFSTAMRIGLPAQVSFEAMGGEVFHAEVSEVSPVLDPASRTLRIRLRFTGPADRRIRAGMFATVSLVTGSREQVPVIPRASVINTYGSWIVFVVRGDNTVERREIELGLENEDTVEITAGLLNGELVVTAGQNFLSDNDPVRVVE